MNAMPTPPTLARSGPAALAALRHRGHRGRRRTAATRLAADRRPPTQAPHDTRAHAGRRDSRRPGTRRSGAVAPPALGLRAPGSGSARAGAAAAVLVRQPPGARPQRPAARAHSAAPHPPSAYEEFSGLASYAPLRPRGANRTSPAVLDARGSRPSDGVIEAFARIVTGDRQRAMAFRLELCDDRRWRCAAVELDGQSPARRR